MKDLADGGMALSCKVLDSTSGERDTMLPTHPRSLQFTPRYSKHPQYPCAKFAKDGAPYVFLVSPRLCNGDKIEDYMNIVWEVVLTLLALAGAVSFGYLKAYSSTVGKKLGELQAMHTGIDLLLEQVNIVQKRQEEIKADVADLMWGRQTQWMIKKEVLFETLRGMGNLQVSLMGMTGTYGAFRTKDSDPTTTSDERKTIAELRRDAITAYNEANSKFGGLRMLAAVIASEDVMKNLLEMQTRFTALALTSGNEGRDPTVEDIADINKHIREALNAIKKDLELPKQP